MTILSSDETKEIDEKAQELLITVFGETANLKLPINLNAVMEHCNLTLREGNFADQDIAAALDRASKTIFVSQGDGLARKTFSVAHELGHYKLHHDVTTDVFYRHQAAHLLGPEDSKRETAANWFAASLLMPEEFVTELWEAIKDIDKMSQVFAVSPSAMRYRLNHLNLIK